MSYPKFVNEIKKHFVFIDLFFSENRTINGNVEKYGRARQATWQYISAQRRWDLHEWHPRLQKHTNNI